MKVSFFGTATLLFDDGEGQILFDAHFTRPGLLKYIFGKGETNTALIDEMITRHRIERLRAIFISHSHHDHVMDAPYISNKCGAVIYGSSSALNVARGGGVPEDRLAEFSGNKSFTLGAYVIRVIRSLHSKPTILNNDLGQTIDAPLVQPARLRDNKEGGSYDFLVEVRGKTYLIRPSFNYIKGQLDGVKADVLFLGVAGLAKADDKTVREFFAETVDKVGPELVIPLHWDNFFSGLDRPIKGMPRLIEKTEEVFFRLARSCEEGQINCLIQPPGTSIEI
ncbi:MAG: MBL fold metallo-hydrolase [Oscillospiraceae bacterium]|nr:MBL fold metallo-hydrolase [Oscillospiraceae bacterium]